MLTSPSVTGGARVTPACAPSPQALDQALSSSHTHKRAAACSPQTCNTILSSSTATNHMHSRSHDLDLDVALATVRHTWRSKHFLEVGFGGTLALGSLRVEKRVDESRGRGGGEGCSVKVASQSHNILPSSTDPITQSSGGYTVMLLKDHTRSGQSPQQQTNKQNMQHNTTSHAFAERGRVLGALERSERVE